MICAQIEGIDERERIACLRYEIERYRMVCQFFGEKQRRQYLDSDSAGGALRSTRAVMSLIVDCDLKSRDPGEAVIRRENETTQSKVNRGYKSSEGHRLVLEAIPDDKGEISG